jgi:hypothetical protein
MKPYIQFALPSGHVFELPTEIIVNDRAAYYFNHCPDEFKTLDEAKVDTTELFDDGYQVRDWLLNNMDVDDVMKKHGRLVAFKPPVLEWSIGEYSLVDERTEVAQPSSKDVMQAPLELIASFMASSHELCAAQTIVDATTGQPAGALVYVAGNQAIVNSYLTGLQIITEQVLAKMEEANKASTSTQH